MKQRIYHGDCKEILPTFKQEFFDSVVTDPPYEIGFMGKKWDKRGVAFDHITWKAVLNVLKPGGYMLAFGGTKTYHRITCAIEDAGFEIRDCLMWMYGTGFPKGKGCLKPAWEPIVLARKPGKGIKPLSIDECRIPCNGGSPSAQRRKSVNKAEPGVIDPDRWVDRRSLETYKRERPEEALGRYPANVVHDGSDEVLEAFAAFGESKPKPGRKGKRGGCNPMFRSKEAGDNSNQETDGVWPADPGGTATRFFYCAKASKREREGSTHPTVKPLALMQYLVKLVTPKEGKLLDPFCGSGSTLIACSREGRKGCGIEQDEKYIEIIRKRLEMEGVKT